MREFQLKVHFDCIPSKTCVIVSFVGFNLCTIYGLSLNQLQELNPDPFCSGTGLHPLFMLRYP